MTRECAEIQENDPGDVLAAQEGPGLGKGALLLTCTSASFMAVQLDTRQAHSSTRYGLMCPLD